jgi:hypothetical protein
MSEGPAQTLTGGGEPSRRASPRFALDVAAWVALVVIGFALVLVYGSTPGRAASAPPRWPAGSALSPATGGAWTLVLFAHPHCPCTRATLDSLARITARAGERVQAQVVLVRDPSVAKGWERGEILEKARRIPGVAIRVDDAGVEARRFGAASSGQALLFDPEGVLRFSGGLTVLRGHAGDSPGSDAVRVLLEGGSTPVAETPVYGCPLFDECDDGDLPCTR